MRVRWLEALKHHFDSSLGEAAEYPVELYLDLLLGLSQRNFRRFDIWMKLSIAGPMLIQFASVANMWIS